ncbi:MAG: pyridoxamine 5'-phosphate oxidase family protein [Isosphaeraceae bacterium]
MMAGSSERAQAIQTLAAKLQGFTVAMLTTVEPDGSLRSRPMVNSQPEFDGDLWFISRGQSRVVWSIQRYARVNLNYVDSRSDRYVSVTGTAHVVRDSQRAKDLWDPSYGSWLSGPDDPELSLIKISVEHAEVWEGPSSTIHRIEGFVKTT